MKARREYRNRDPVEVSVLDALVEWRNDGMTVFELRAEVDADIDDLEEALSSLKADGLIELENEGNRSVILPADRVVPEETGQEGSSFLDRIRERFF